MTTSRTAEHAEAPRTARGVGLTDLNEVRLQALVGALELFHAIACHEANGGLSPRPSAAPAATRAAARAAHRGVALLLDHVLRGARGPGASRRLYARTLSRLWLAVRELDRRAGREPADPPDTARIRVYHAASVHLAPVLRDADRAPLWLRQLSRAS